MPLLVYAATPKYHVPADRFVITYEVTVGFVICTVWLKLFAEVP